MTGIRNYWRDWSAQRREYYDGVKNEAAQAVDGKWQAGGQVFDSEKADRDWVEKNPYAKLGLAERMRQAAQTEDGQTRLMEAEQRINNLVADQYRQAANWNARTGGKFGANAKAAGDSAAAAAGRAFGGVTDALSDIPGVSAEGRKWLAMGGHLANEALNIGQTAIQGLAMGNSAGGASGENAALNMQQALQSAERSKFLRGSSEAASREAGALNAESGALGASLTNAAAAGSGAYYGADGTDYSGDVKYGGNAERNLDYLRRSDARAVQGLYDQMTGRAGAVRQGMAESFDRLAERQQFENTSLQINTRRGIDLPQFNGPGEEDANAIYEAAIEGAAPATGRELDRKGGASNTGAGKGRETAGEAPAAQQEAASVTPAAADIPQETQAAFEKMTEGFNWENDAQKRAAEAAYAKGAAAWKAWCDEFNKQDGVRKIDGKRY